MMVVAPERISHQNCCSILGGQFRALEWGSEGINFLIGFDATCSPTVTGGASEGSI